MVKAVDGAFALVLLALVDGVLILVALGAKTVHAEPAVVATKADRSPPERESVISGYA